MSKADELQQRTAAFADLSIEFVTGLPETQVVRRISLQFLDASTSVGANYRAARRAKSHADFVSKIGTVSEEADESVYWLQRMVKANIRSTTVSIEPLLSEAEELARILGHHIEPLNAVVVDEPRSSSAALPLFSRVSCVCQ
jgi:four helix bundle protein